MSMAEILTTKLLSYTGYEGMNISYVTRTYTLVLIGIRKKHQRSFWKSTHKIMKFSMSGTSYPCHAPTSIWEFFFAFPWEMVPYDNNVSTKPMTVTCNQKNLWNYVLHCPLWAKFFCKTFHIICSCITNRVNLQPVSTELAKINIVPY